MQRSGPVPALADASPKAASAGGAPPTQIDIGAPRRTAPVDLEREVPL